MKRIARAAVLFCVLVLSLAHAHKPSDSYLSLDTTRDDARIAGQWDIALRDLDHAIGVDIDGDGAVTWGELRGREQEIVRFAFAHLAIRQAGRNTRDVCPLQFDRLLADSHVDGMYAVLRFHADCAGVPAELAIDYSLLFDVDPAHRGLLKLRTQGGDQAAVFSTNDAHLRFALNATDPGKQLRFFVAEGVWHILHGYDHLLFLFTLLLPAVVIYRDGRWEPRPCLRDAVLDILKTVTAFTLAHSVTLSAAALGAVTLPSRVVESAIALTVVLGALNNLFPVVTRRRWLVALVFGLIHGFGFASVLSDLGLERANLAVALFGFNVGVELGQLAVVLVLAPLIYVLRESVLYRRVVMPAGAVAIGVVALYWFVARAFGVTGFGLGQW